MVWIWKKGKKARRWLILGMLLLVVVAVSGCQTVSFYRQAIAGQYEIFAHQQNLQKIIDAPGTARPLKERLELVKALRLFAAQDLKLPVDGHYQKYVDLHRPYVVWNVEAAPEFSLQPKSWWYPLVGSLEYRGYFSEKAAQKYGAVLQKKQYDVYVGGVEAYSTLGWFKDPLLNTFIHHREPELAEILFHELGHQRLFARGDEDFNEAFATTVGEVGARRWLEKKGDAAEEERYRAELKRNDQFVHLIMKTRDELIVLYGDERNEEGKLKATRQVREPDELRRQKKAVFERLQQEYARLKESWSGVNEYDEWFQEVNNAKLNSVAAYYDLLPGFERLLELNGGDLEKFYAEAERLSRKTKKDRQQWLRALGHQQK